MYVQYLLYLKLRDSAPAPFVVVPTALAGLDAVPAASVPKSECREVRNIFFRSRRDDFQAPQVRLSKIVIAGQPSQIRQCFRPGATLPVAVPG
jgi:hypothetical protein